MDRLGWGWRDILVSIWASKGCSYGWGMIARSYLAAGGSLLTTIQEIFICAQSMHTPQWCHLEVMSSYHRHQGQHQGHLGTTLSHFCAPYHKVCPNARAFPPMSPIWWCHSWMTSAHQAQYFWDNSGLTGSILKLPFGGGTFPASQLAHCGEAPCKTKGFLPWWRLVIPSIGPLVIVRFSLRILRTFIFSMTYHSATKARPNGACDGWVTETSSKLPFHLPLKPPWCLMLVFLMAQSLELHAFYNLASENNLVVGSICCNCNVMRWVFKDFFCCFMISPILEGSPQNRHHKFYISHFFLYGKRPDKLRWFKV